MGYLDDAAKADLLAAAAKSIDSTKFGVLSDEDVSSLVQTYFRHITLEDLVERSPAEIATDVAKHLRVAANRPQGTAVIRVRTPDPRADGEALPSVIEIVTDDMPFIVDSVTMEVSRSGHAIQLVIHPQILARRDVTGALRGLASKAAGSGDGSGGEVIAESWVRVEIDRVTGADDRRALEERLHHVLRDVREAVEDWPKMRATAVAVADEITLSPPVGLPQDELDETVELLRGWPTTTSRSSATASTSWSTRAAARRSRRCLGPDSGSSGPTRSARRRSRTCAARCGARHARSSC